MAGITFSATTGTLSGTYTGTNVTLLSNASLYVSPTGSLASGNLRAVYGPAARPGHYAPYANIGNVLNKGTIQGDLGIDFRGGGAVTNYRLIKSGFYDAIYLGGGFNEVVNGTTVFYGNQFSDAVANFGTIETTGANFNAIDIDRSYFPVDITNKPGALISATRRGVFVNLAPGSLTNYGTVSASSNVGVYFRQFDVNNPLSSVIVANNGTAALIAGGQYGVQITAKYSANVLHAATVINSGTISGGRAVELVVRGTVNNSGALVGQVGVYGAGGTDTVINSGTINAANLGVGLHYLNGAVKNSGSILGGTGNGVALYAGGTVTNTAGLIRGHNGIGVAAAAGFVDNAGSIVGVNRQGVGLGKGGSIHNSGLIGGYAGAVYIGGGVGTVTNDGQINGTHYGIGLHGSGTITNTGTIQGTSANGVALYAGGSVTNTAGLIIGYNGVGVAAAAGFVSNAGSIAGVFRQGVGLGAGGSIDNSGQITGFSDAVYIGGGSGTVTNTGRISGQSGFGIDLAGGGTIVHSGTVSGSGTAISFGGTGGNRLVLDPGFVINGKAVAAGVGNVLELASTASSGTIAGLGTAFMGFGNVAVDAGASWTLSGNNSLATGTVLTDFGTLNNTGVLFAAPGAGIYLPSGGTLIDSGTITGSGAPAVNLAGKGSHVLALRHGYSLTGGIVLSASASNTIELSGVLGSITASYESLGLGGFQTIAFSNPGTTTVVLKSSKTNGIAAPTIAGFTVSGNAIDLTSLSDASDTAHYSLVGNSLTVFGDNGAVQFNLSDVPAHLTVQNDGSSGTMLLVPCFVAGTRIATPAGEIPVERLAIGDRVTTLRGGAARPIVWIGTGQALATRGRRNAATPVIVKKGALADGIPCRDLRITKGHALFIDGVLIPVEELVNHRSIMWDDRAQEVTVYHIELETHDVLVANGAPAESYRDDGNRWLFQNANAGWHLPPLPACAPVLTGGDVVDAVWRRLLDRCEARKGVPLTDDPDLHLLVDGKRIDAIEQRSDMYVFRLSTRPRTVRIRSRAGVPQELGLARDARELGVALRQIVLAQPRRQQAVDADAKSLVNGFHTFEPGNGIRWTNGDAAVPAEFFAGMSGASMLMLHLCGTTQYVDDGPVHRAA